MINLNRLRTLTALALVCSTTLAVAQPKPTAESKPKPAAESAKKDDAWARRVPVMTFDNIPLSEVVNFLSEAEAFPEINFVLDPAVKDIAISIKLRAVTLDDIFTAIEISTQSGGKVVDPNTGLANQIAVQANKLNERMVSFTYRQSPLQPVMTPTCRAFSLSRYLAGKDENQIDTALSEIEDALNTCWDMMKKSTASNSKIESPQLKLHRGTKLLIVVGQDSQVGVVAQVIDQLEQGAAVSGAMIDPATGLPASGFFPGASGAPGGFSPSPARIPGAK